MDIKVRKLTPDATLPTYATAGAAGFDLYAAADVIIAPGETVKVPLGLAFEIPDGYEMQIRPRSGITLKTKLRVSNSPATIDSDFRSEVCVIIDNIARGEQGSTPRPRNLAGKTEYYDGTHYPKFTYIIRKGDRLCQGIIAPVCRAVFEETEKLSETIRGGGSFGSTGTR